MTVSRVDFNEFFVSATGIEEGPFPYQKRLATGDELPSLIDVPTGCGKTSAAVLGWLWRRRFADEETRKKTPRRLVYCLPMRVLVEQTRDNVIMWLHNLELLGGTVEIQDGKFVSYDQSWEDPEKICVTVLMGGEDRDEWDLYPERDAVIIGTQDMLLSRALNRGYGMSRYRWPIHFGLLNNDCLWVMDEVQLMGSGLATSVQMQAFRRLLGSTISVQSMWMSATMNPEWLETVDFNCTLDIKEEISFSDADRKYPKLKPRLHAFKQIKQADFKASSDGEIEAKLVYDIHRPKSRTLVVVNTVKRAQEVFKALKKCKPDADIMLLHSRFRKNDRKDAVKRALAKPGEHGTIVVSTQVIEAGVDVSSQVLITDLAPWSSMIQRFGRCNRKGEFNESKDAKIIWISPPNLEDEKKLKAAPYTFENLQAAAERLTPLTNAGPSSLPSFDDPMTFAHVIRRKDLIELFDTTPDLAGADIDVSRFIREADEHHLQVFWRDVSWKGPEEDEPGPAREELCNVPIGDINIDKRDVWRWDYLEKCWDKATVLYPGLTLMLRADQGGYSTEFGWTGKEKHTDPCEIIGKPLDYNDRDRWSEGRTWRTIAEHTDGVVKEVEKLLNAHELKNTPWANEIRLAARWHDIGKSHNVFQSAIPDGAPSVTLWAKSKPQMKRYKRPGFRHGLASALAMLAHGHSDLAAYLAAAHHGRVRLSIRSMPHEKPPEDDPERLFARGIWHGDVLPAVDLGNGVLAPVTTLALTYMEMGEDEHTGPSWLSRMLELRDNKIGLFRLVFIETLLRVADWRASASEKEVQ